MFISHFPSFPLCITYLLALFLSLIIFLLFSHIFWRSYTEATKCPTQAIAHCFSLLPYRYIPILWRSYTADMVELRLCQGVTHTRNKWLTQGPSTLNFVQLFCGSLSLPHSPSQSLPNFQQKGVMLRESCHFSTHPPPSHPPPHSFPFAHKTPLHQ